MSTPQKKDKTVPHPRKIHKRLLDNGAKESSFHHTLGKQPKTVYPPLPPHTDVLSQGQQTGSSRGYSNPQDSAQTSGSPVVPELGQAAHTNQWTGQMDGTHPVSGYLHTHPGHAAPISSDTAPTGEATAPAYPHISSLYNPYGAYSMYAPHSTESHFHAGTVYETMPQMPPQGQPPRCQWDQASLPVHHRMGAMGYSQPMGAQPNVTAGDQPWGHNLSYVQQSPHYRFGSSQFPPMYDASNHVDSTGSAADGSRYLPASHSPGSGANGTQR